MYYTFHIQVKPLAFTSNLTTHSSLYLQHSPPCVPDLSNGNLVYLNMLQLSSIHFHFTHSSFLTSKYYHFVLICIYLKTPSLAHFLTFSSDSPHIRSCVHKGQMSYAFCKSIIPIYILSAFALSLMLSSFFQSKI